MDISQTAGKELSGQQYEPHDAPHTMDEVITVKTRTVYAISM